MNRFPFSPDAIRMLADILIEKGLVEIEIAEKDSRIRIVQAPANGARESGVAVSVSHTQPPSAAAKSVSAPSSPAAPPAGAVLSPMVGIVYLSPEPDKPPFVTAGQQVEAGQTLLLIEAMKSFNPITAPIAGVVKQIMVDNQQIAEFGQLLMLVE